MDIENIMNELLKETAPDEQIEQEQEQDIYMTPEDVRDANSGHDDDDDYYEDEDEDEDEWEYQEEYDEWENEMESLDNDYVQKIDEIRCTLEDIYDMVNDGDHRYWASNIENMKEVIRAMDSSLNSLYNVAEDYRSDPRDW